MVTKTNLKKKAMGGYIAIKGGAISTLEAVAFETGFNAGYKARAKIDRSRE